MVIMASMAMVGSYSTTPRIEKFDFLYFVIEASRGCFYYYYYYFFNHVQVEKGRIYKKQMGDRPHTHYTYIARSQTKT